jgi:hypothetical protein
MVKPSDVQGANYPQDFGHALPIRYWRTCATGQAHPRFVPPATSGDGTYTGSSCMPMGARVQLDPSIDCASTSYAVKHGPWAAALCRTFQRYGGIVVDTGASIDVQVFNTDWNAYPWASQYNTGCFSAGCDQSASIAMPNDLMARFRVIDWTRWTGA